MIALNRRTKVFVCKQATDMRASYDSLFSKVKSVLQKDPFSGHLCLFVNGKRTSCKCLYWDGTGLVILSKRLERDSVLFFFIARKGDNATPSGPRLFNSLLSQLYFERFCGLFDLI